MKYEAQTKKRIQSEKYKDTILYMIKIGSRWIHGMVIPLEQK